MQTVSPATPAQVATRVNASLDALLSLHRGTSVPSYSTAGTIWANATNTEDIIFYDDGASSIKMGKIDVANDKFFPANIPFVRDVYRNLIVKNNATHADHQLDIDADELVLKDSSGDGYTISAVDITVDVAATGLNGLDAGAEATGTWYHAWVVGNGATYGGILTAATTPTLPTGYTYKAYITSVRNGAADFAAIKQRDNHVMCAPTAVLSGGNATVYTAVSSTAVVPVTAKNQRGYMWWNSATSGNIWIAGDASGIGEIAVGLTAGNAAPFSLPIVSNPSSGIFYKMSNASQAGYVTISGWDY